MCSQSIINTETCLGQCAGATRAPEVAFGFQECNHGTVQYLRCLRQQGPILLCIRPLLSRPEEGPVGVLFQGSGVNPVFQGFFRKLQGTSQPSRHSWTKPGRRSRGTGANTMRPAILLLCFWVTMHFFCSVMATSRIYRLARYRRR